MHKSVIIFLGLLTFLMPLGNSNMNFSNANAITDFDEADKKQVSVSSLNCNNINVNVNGLKLDVFPLFLGGDSGLATEAVEGIADPNLIGGNGDNSASEINDFKFICINNNNNTVIEAEEPTPPIPPSQGTTLYVTNFRDNTVEIYDINNPTAPVRISQFNGGNLNSPVGIAIQGTTLYVTNQGDDSVSIVEISNPFGPLFIDTIDREVTT